MSLCWILVILLAIIALVLWRQLLKWRDWKNQIRDWRDWVADNCQCPGGGGTPPPPPSWPNGGW
jgi:hypothetical protein